MVTSDEQFMDLTTFIVPSDGVEWEVTVMSPQATATLLSMLPDGEFDVGDFVRKNYLVIAEQIVAPSILKPKVPFNRLKFNYVVDIFQSIYDESFPRTPEEEEEPNGSKLPK